MGLGIGGGPDTTPSMIVKMMTGEQKGSPNFWNVPVDICDVALAHARALTREQAANKRFLLVGDESFWMVGMANRLADSLEEAGYNYPVSRATISYPTMWMLSKFVPEIKGALPLIDLQYNFNCTMSHQFLGIEYKRTAKELVFEMAE